MPSRIKITVSILCLGFGLAVSAGVAPSVVNGPAAANAPAAIDPSFWALKLPTMAGDTLDFKSLRGKYVLLNFWGEWCGTCVEEIPFLIKLNDRYGKDRLHIVGLIKTNDPIRANKLIRKSQMGWPQVPLPENLEKEFAIRKFPTNLLISPQGEIVMYGFSHHFKDFKRRMGEVDSASEINKSEIKLPSANKTVP